MCCIFITVYARSDLWALTVGAGISAVGHRAQASVFPGGAGGPLVPQAVCAHRAAVGGEGAAGSPPMAQALTWRRDKRNQRLTRLTRLTRYDSRRSIYEDENKKMRRH